MESSHPAHGWRRTLASQLLGNFAAGCCPFQRHHKPNKISNEWCFHGKRALKAYTPGKPNKNKSVQVWGKNRRKISSRLQPHSSATAQLPHSLPSEWTLDWIWVNPNKPEFFLILRLKNMIQGTLHILSCSTPCGQVLWAAPSPRLWCSSQAR